MSPNIRVLLVDDHAVVREGIRAVLEDFDEIHVVGDRATVDMRYDISFQLLTEVGEKWERRQNEKRLELKREGNRWMFLAGY